MTGCALIVGREFYTTETKNLATRARRRIAVGGAFLKTIEIAPSIFGCASSFFGTSACFYRRETTTLSSMGNPQGDAMKSATVAVGILIAAATTAAAEEPALATITITAKPPHASVPTAERVPPKSTVEIVAPLPTDMPEAELDYHVASFRPARVQRLIS